MKKINLTKPSLILKFVIVLVCAVSSVPIDDQTSQEVDNSDTDTFIQTHGSSIDYSYNETALEAGDKTPSSPGCPRSIDNQRWVYYRTSVNVKCYLTGERGPCMEGQLLTAQDGELFGYCHCDCSSYVEVEKGDKVEFCQWPNGRPPVVYFTEGRTCFVLYNQGPCNDGDWLVKVNATDSSLATTICEKRRCHLNQVPVLADDGSLSSCESPKTQTLSFLFSSLSNISQGRCKNGRKYSGLLRGCVKDLAGAYGRGIVG